MKAYNILKGSARLALSAECLGSGWPCFMRGGELMRVGVVRGLLFLGGVWLWVSVWGVVWRLGSCLGW